MFANDIEESTGNPLCMCGQPVLPNRDLPEGDGQRGSIVQGSKGLVILHNKCIEEHNALVQIGLI